MKVLICGGRDFSDQELFDETMIKLGPFKEIIHGGATGADAMAHEWALANAVTVTTYKADWEKHGKAAGPIRNQFMLREGKPDLVIAFPGGTGTADMVLRAREAGVEVIEL